MQVILKENVKDLGHIGEVVNVKDGYARNFLIPRGLAVEANPKNIKAMEHEKRKIQELAKKAKASAEELSARIYQTAITIKVKTGEEDRLFGSVTAIDIADALKKEGIDVDRKKIVIDEPIKRLGDYTVSVKIHPDVTAQLNVKVVSE
ncbi:50S ribosomal protein L9 [Dissulfurispira thermophila]|uniref:Large ribosomal subunit protein bL9 n=2 Tax=root TaxID=1 RepID=A0A7G1H1P4_9BACT|nr:50S ribosomal protein L9 [Dissulfurispira thermophila]BCB96725.1 50S ribosomal protein L9 [Dissulfurispira thermophila]